MSTIYLSNWSSHRTPGAHGPGRKLSIMARPRSWEWGDGRVDALAPLGDLESLMIAALEERAGSLVDGPAMRAYHDAYTARVRRLDLRPGYLVLDGDTLCCACSSTNARAGLCHRAWLAPLFREWGWQVVLDGAEFNASAPPPAPPPTRPTPGSAG